MRNAARQVWSRPMVGLELDEKALRIGLDGSSSRERDCSEQNRKSGRDRDGSKLIRGRLGKARHLTLDVEDCREMDDDRKDGRLKVL